MLGGVEVSERFYVTYAVFLEIRIQLGLVGQASVATSICSRYLLQGVIT